MIADEKYVLGELLGKGNYGRVYVARGYLPPGEHTVSINGRQLPQPIKIDGQYALVPLRMYDNSVLIGDVAMLGQLPTVAAAPQPAPAAAAAAPAAPVRTINNNRGAITRMTSYLRTVALTTRVPRNNSRARGTPLHQE